MKNAPYKLWTLQALKNECTQRKFDSKDFSEVKEKNVLIKLLEADDAGKLVSAPEPKKGKKNASAPEPKKDKKTEKRSEEMEDELEDEIPVSSPPVKGKKKPDLAPVVEVDELEEELEEELPAPPQPKKGKKNASPVPEPEPEELDDELEIDEVEEVPEPPKKGKKNASAPEPKKDKKVEKVPTPEPSKKGKKTAPVDDEVEDEIEDEVTAPKVKKNMAKDTAGKNLIIAESVKLNEQLKAKGLWVKGCQFLSKLEKTNLLKAKTEAQRKVIYDVVETKLSSVSKVSSQNLKKYQEDKKKSK